MEARDVVHRPAVMCRPETTIGEAARRMQAEQVGSILVVNELGIAGILTDRDIVVRGCAEGLDPNAHVESIMSPEVQYVFDDTDLFTVASKMAQSGCRRLPVVGSENGVTGVIALDDLIVVFADQISKLATAVRKELAHTP